MVDIHLDGLTGFVNNCKNKKVICFGAGRHFDTLIDRYGEILSNKIDYVSDSKYCEISKERRYKDKKWRVLSKEEMIDIAKKEKILILITLQYDIIEVIQMLDSIPQLDNVITYVGSFIKEKVYKPESINVKKIGEEKIPRVIHYCWFGGNDIPDINKRHMESWKKFNPEYDIVRWDETNYDVNINRYMKQAYESRKWAFVSDYARIDIINKYGGIYLDCDVEVVKPFDDLLYNDMFCGFEDDSYINLGLGYGSQKNHPYLEKLLELYSNLEFIDSNGKINLTPCTEYQTIILKELGMYANGTFQSKNSITVYPRDYFSPVSYYEIGEVTNNTYSVHHYEGSWIDSDKQFNWRLLKQIGKWLYVRYKLQNN